MEVWEQRLLHTARGVFEVFVAGQGEPLCVTHYYSAFNGRGNYFADRFTDDRQVVLVNLKECGNSEPIKDESELAMVESVEDLEAINPPCGTYSAFSNRPRQHTFGGAGAVCPRNSRILRPIRRRDRR
jgi:proline iminopeptidase